MYSGSVAAHLGNGCAKKREKEKKGNGRDAASLRVKNFAKASEGECSREVAGDEKH